jgi:hypothetical protein
MLGSKKEIGKRNREEREKLNERTAPHAAHERKVGTCPDCWLSKWMVYKVVWIHQANKKVCIKGSFLLPLGF